jgi:hypothetical protein
MIVSLSSISRTRAPLGDDLNRPAIHAVEAGPVGKLRRHVMRRVLWNSAVTGAIYLILTVLTVMATSKLGEGLWVPLVAYIGPTTCFFVILALNRRVFWDIRNKALRWAALVGCSAVIAAAVSFLAFVVAVNTHLALGGRI